ncbi:hypothetical protein ABKN59_011580 [Abortiporus biennis]
MDSLFAIGVGLGFRAILDAVTNHNTKATALVGIWEGVVLNHFLVKLPTSFDPYVAFGFRLFVDFLFTESLARMTIIVLWTGLGMVFADLAVEMWADRRFRRLWRRVKRSLSIPSIRKLRRHAPLQLGRVRFIEGSSTTSTSRTSVRSPTTPQTPLVSILRRPTTHPIPGQFDSFSEISASSSNIPPSLLREFRRGPRLPTPPRSRSSSPNRSLPSPHLRLPTPPLQREPSELEYEGLPDIPDQSPVEQPEDTRSVGSGLTTDREVDRDLHPDDRPRVHSGLTTPDQQYSPLHAQDVPPVRILSEELQHTPSTSLLDLPPIPIRPPPLDLLGNNAEDPISMPEPHPAPHISALFDAAQPSPGLIPPVSEIPNIPSTDDLIAGGESNRDTLVSRSPPPKYEEPIEKEVVAPQPPSPDTEGEMGESVISGHSRGSIILRAEDLRRQAQAQEAERDRLRFQLKEAQKENRFWDALKLEVELEEAHDKSRELHAKAAHRFFKAHNLTPEPHSIDVHRLNVQEATIQVKRALRDAYTAGSPKLRIITGRGKHSKKNIPVLKLALVGELQKFHIEAIPDESNPGVLLVGIPNASTSGAGPSSST